MSSTLILTFSSETSGSEKLSIKNVIDTIDETQINNLSNKIIEKNIFFGKTGDYTSLESAEIVTTTKVKII